MFKEIYIYILYVSILFKPYIVCNTKPYNISLIAAVAVTFHLTVVSREEWPVVTLRVIIFNLHVWMVTPQF